MRTRKKLGYLIFSVFILGFLIPQNFKMPVIGANRSSYHPQSFWYYPWGKSGTHKGVDIFAPNVTEVASSTHGLVLYTGNISMGGNVVLILGPKWRLHYYAHLKENETKMGRFVSNKTRIGSVGNSGNAIGKPPHLHYSIFTLIPYPWRIDGEPQGWKKMFYLNPINYL